MCVDIGREQPSAQQRMQQQKKRDDSEGPRAAAATAATTAAASLITMNNKNPGVAPNQALPTDDEVPPFSELRGSRSNTNTSTNLISPRSYRKIKSLRAKLMADANHSPYQKKGSPDDDNEEEEEEEEYDDDDKQRTAASDPTDGDDHDSSSVSSLTFHSKKIIPPEPSSRRQEEGDDDDDDDDDAGAAMVVPDASKRAENSHHAAAAAAAVDTSRASSAIIQNWVNNNNDDDNASSSTIAAPPLATTTATSTATTTATTTTTSQTQQPTPHVRQPLPSPSYRPWQQLPSSQLAPPAALSASTSLLVPSLRDTLAAAERQRELAWHDSISSPISTLTPATFEGVSPLPVGGGGGGGGGNYNNNSNSGIAAGGGTAAARGIHPKKPSVSASLLLQSSTTTNTTILAAERPVKPSLRDMLKKSTIFQMGYDEDQYHSDNNNNNDNDNNDDDVNDQGHPAPDHDAAAADTPRASGTVRRPWETKKRLSKKNKKKNMLTNTESDDDNASFTLARLPSETLLRDNRWHVSHSMNSSAGSGFESSVGPLDQFHNNTTDHHHNHNNNNINNHDNEDNNHDNNDNDRSHLRQSRSGSSLHGSSTSMNSSILSLSPRRILRRPTIGEQLYFMASSDSNNSKNNNDSNSHTASESNNDSNTLSASGVTGGASLSNSAPLNDSALQRMSYHKSPFIDDGSIEPSEEYDVEEGGKSLAEEIRKAHNRMISREKGERSSSSRSSSSSATGHSPTDKATKRPASIHEDEEDSPLALIRRETIILLILRLTVILTLMSVTAVTIFLIYHRTVGMEQTQYQNDLMQISSVLMGNFLFNFRTQFALAQATATALTQYMQAGHMMQYNLNMSTVSFQDITRAQLELLSPASVDMVTWSPYLTSRRERAEFEDFAAGLYPGGIFRLENGTASSDQSAPPYAPIWLQATKEVPPAGTHNDQLKSPLLFNQYSNPLYAKYLNRMVNSEGPVLSEQFARTGPFYEEYSVGGAVGEPGVVLFYPVFNETMQIIGIITTYLDWRNVLQTSERQVPMNIDLVNLVFENTCGQMIAFKLANSDSALVLTDQSLADIIDLRNPAFSTSYEDFTRSVQEFTPSIGPLVNASCLYRLSIYATTNLEAHYFTREPVKFAVAGSVVFLFTCLTFIIYDFMLNRKQRRVMESAIRSNAIVSQLFPKVCSVLLLRRH